MNDLTISNEILLQQIFSVSVDTAMSVVNADFELVYLNPTAEKFFNCEAKQVLGQSVRKLHINNKHASSRFDQAVAKINAGEHFEYRVEQSGVEDTRYLGMRLSGLWENKQLTGYLLLATDITQRHQQEQELETQQRHFRNLYEQAPAPYLSLDSDGRILHVNRAWLDTFGYHKQDTIGRLLLDLIVDTQKKAFAKKFESFKRKSEVLSAQFSMHHADGRVMTVSVTGKAINDAAGHFRHSHCILTDITARNQLQDELIKSAARYHNLFNYMRDALIIFSPDKLLIEEVNPAAEKLFGYSRQQLLGMQIPELSADARVTRDTLDKMVRENQSEISVANCQIRRKDNTLQSVEISVIQIEMEGQTRLLGNVRNITERLIVERALIESESRYRTIFANAAAGMATASTSGQFLSVNQTLCDFLGYSERELLKLSIKDIIHPDDLTLSNRLSNESSEQAHQGYQLEKRYLRRDGATVWGLLSYSWVNDESGKPDYTIRLIQDITAEMQIRQELRLASFALDQAADSIFWLTPKADIFYVNDAACQALGYSRDELLSMNVSDFDPNFPSEVNAKMWRRIQHEGSVRIESIHRRKNGSEYAVEISANYLNHDNQEFNCAIARDISDRKQTEMEKEQLQRELQQTSKMEALGQLTGGIAHDFNNMLATILGFTDLIQHHIPTELKSGKVPAYLAEIDIAGQRGKELVEQMLRFSRNDSGKQQLLSLTPLVEEAIKLLTSTLPTSIQIELDIATSIPAIMADPIQIHQALFNLCLNARDTLEGKGKLHIGLYHLHDLAFECSACHVQVQGDWIELAITDNGQSIPAEIQQKIFDPFFTTKQPGKGTGLGLSVVNSILHRHKAHVILQSKPGHGSSFRLLFPVPDSQEIPVTKKIDDNKTIHSPTLKNIRILLVDDDVSVLRALHDYLELMGLQPTAVNSSQLALDLFSENPDNFDLILTDQTMPVLTGIELIKQIHCIQPKIPTILVSGWSDAVNPQNATKQGITRFFQKPVNNQQLLAEIMDIMLPRTNSDNGLNH